MRVIPVNTFRGEEKFFREIRPAMAFVRLGIVPSRLAVGT